MPGLKDLLASGVTAAIGSITDGASKIISNFKADPTKVAEAEAAIEKLKIEAATKAEELANTLELARIEEQKNEDNNVSDRWRADMTSDSKLSKMTRPLVVLSLLGFLFIIIITDSIEGIRFDVKPDYVNLLSTLLVTVMIAYFGSKGIEKVKKINEVKHNK
jgi:hypothetical protein